MNTYSGPEVPRAYAAAGVQAKPFWQSKSLVGGAGVVLGVYLPIILPWFGVTDPDLILQIVQLVAGPSGILAIVGRLTARRTLK